MITLLHFIRLAVHNLRRGGQRVLVALLCITFGIMALVAMMMIAKSIQGSLRVGPAELIGGDLSLVRTSEAVILPEHVDQLAALEQSGQISRYTLIAYTSASIQLRSVHSGEAHFAGLGLGIQPDRYPLAGSLTIGEPGSTGLPTLLQQVGDTIITRDIALEYKLKLGDPIVLTDLHTGLPLEGTVRGIAYDTPNHQGDKVYYTIETAQKLAGGQPVVNTAIVNTTHAKTVSAALNSSGWTVDWAADRRSGNPANLWVIGLRAAGILGLLVGGTGIANTMQVLLRRRWNEVAIWKTLGYREGHLRLIFSLEAGLLGLGGSLLGAGLGVLISGQVLALIRRISTVLYQWTFSPDPALMGILLGTLTTLIFAAWAIIASSQTRPMLLLRNQRYEECSDVQRRPGCLPGGRMAMYLLLLGVPFTALASLVMESLAAGILVLVFILFGIAMLAGFFSALLWLCSRVVPLGRFPLARMAFHNLGRRGLSLVFAMIALFTGVLSMSLGLAVTQFGEMRFSGQPDDFQRYNLNILAAAGQESAIRQVVQAQNPQKVGVGYRTALAGIRVNPASSESSALAGEGRPLDGMQAVLVGRSDPEDYRIRGADWGSQPDGVYTYQEANLPAGSQVEVTFRDGTTKTFTVVGSYDFNDRSINLPPPAGLLMTADAFNRAARPDALIYFVQVAPNQVQRAAAALRAALPQAAVVNLGAYAARYMHSYRKMFILPVALSALALLAGLLLVANTVSLAMLDRRYEIGILKTIGYARRQILLIFAVEYGLAGLLATGAAVLVIQGLLAVLAIATNLPASVLLLTLLPLMLIALGGTGLTVLIVCGVAWGPTRVAPIIVLNERT